MRRDHNELPEWFGTFSLIVVGVFVIGFGVSVLGGNQPSNQFGTVTAISPPSTIAAFVPVPDTAGTTPEATTPNTQPADGTDATVEVSDTGGGVTEVPAAAYAAAERAGLAAFTGRWDGVEFADGGAAPLPPAQIWPDVHVISAIALKHTDTLIEIVFSLATDSANTDLRRSLVDVILVDDTWVYYRK